MKFLNKLKTAVINQYDPDREDRVNQLTTKLYVGLSKEREAFQLNKILGGIEVSSFDLKEAQNRTFERVLQNVWKDGLISPGERKTLDWIIPALEISEKKAKAMFDVHANAFFEKQLTRAFAAGKLDTKTEQHLQHLADAMGVNRAEYTYKHFKKQVIEFLSGQFDQITQQANFLLEQWIALGETAKALGVEKGNLCKLLKDKSTIYVEHVLADAKADGQLDEDEKQTINTLLTCLGLNVLDKNFCQYVLAELNEFERHANIASGRLPNVSFPDWLEHQMGEILHGFAEAELSITRKLKSGDRIDQFSGTLCVLDNRLVFQSPEKALAIRYSSLIALTYDEPNILFQEKNKAIRSFRLAAPDSLFFEILRMAVAISKQRIVVNASGERPSRHISRDVRQRVWQTYGGRCVDCGASDYLEYDHIIPHSKGGSNDENNIQLLCRRCNLKKSDHI